MGLTSLIRLLNHHYDDDTNDYWMPPLIKSNQAGAIGRISNGDGVIFACRRGEREIQLMEAFVQSEFPHFPRVPLSLHFFPLVSYHPKFANEPLFTQQPLADTLGEVLAANQRTQLRMAESEKYAHVTYFFNGRRQPPFPGENRIQIPSLLSKEYHPAMRTLELASQLKAQINRDYSFILLNLAAGDIFGHIPDFVKQVACAEYIDEALGEVVPIILAHDRALLITADHGLLEQSFLPDGSYSLSHTNALVNCTLVARDFLGKTQSLGRVGGLAQVAPTVLALLGIDKPVVMEEPLPLNTQRNYRQVVLVVLDGFGVGKDDPRTNPMVAASTPILDELLAIYPNTKLQASGEAVGLLATSSGNSESGHLTLGVGRVVQQDEARILKALASGKLSHNSKLGAAIQQVKRTGHSFHIILLLSKQSSHGSMDEALGIINHLKEQGITRVYCHCITDGRSAPAQAGAQLIQYLQEKLAIIGAGEIVTLLGRGFALDRSQNYQETTRVAYQALVEGKGINWSESG